MRTPYNNISFSSAEVFIIYNINTLKRFWLLQTTTVSMCVHIIYNMLPIGLHIMSILALIIHSRATLCFRCNERLTRRVIV